MEQSTAALHMESSLEGACNGPSGRLVGLGLRLQEPDSRDVFEMESTGFMVHWMRGGGAAER